MIREAYIKSAQAPCLTDYVDGLFVPRDASESLNDMAVREVASALEAYAKLEGDEVIDTRNLAFWAASAVRALGRDDLAVEAVIMGTGTVYPQTLESVEDDVVWVINTERLFPDISTCTELAFFSVLYNLVGNMVHLWDRSEGEGVLGLKRLRALSSVFAGGKGGQKESAAWVEIMLRAVADRLKQCSVDRGWSAIPRVMMLD